MVVTLKLFASLADLLPPGVRQGNRITVEVEENQTVAQLLARFAVPPEMAKLVLRNGLFVPPEEREVTRLADGDEIAVWPPVAGG
ncbi:hypothetical protein JCM16106_10340 [Hydrogenophilus islandicus]|jgi:sulfur carrier protein ThiS